MASDCDLTILGCVEEDVWADKRLVAPAYARMPAQSHGPVRERPHPDGEISTRDQAESAQYMPAAKGGGCRRFRGRDLHRSKLPPGCAPTRHASIRRTG